MTLTGKPPKDLWSVDTDAEDDKLALYVELREAMRTAARRGIRRRIRRDPSEADVEDVVVHAFNEFWDRGLDSVKSPVGLACKIAADRGFDRGRRNSRELASDRRKNDAWARQNEDDVLVDEAEHVTTMLAVRNCEEHLSIGQRDVIRATIEGTAHGVMALKDFAEERGTSYEACRRMRKRGLADLLSCVEAALGMERSRGR